MSAERADDPLDAVQAWYVRCCDAGGHECRLKVASSRAQAEAYAETMRALFPDRTYHVTSFPDSSPQLARGAVAMAIMSSVWPTVDREEWPPEYPQRETMNCGNDTLTFEGQKVQVLTDYLGHYTRFADAGQKWPEYPTWETMVFGGPEAINPTMWRWDTEEQARVSHQLVVDVVTRYLDEQRRALDGLRGLERSPFNSRITRAALARAVELLERDGMPTPDYFDIPGAVQ